MASHRLFPLLLALGLGAVAAVRETEFKEFSLPPNSYQEYEMPLNEIYAVLGPGEEPTTCMEFETENDTQILIGGCNNYTSLGYFGSQMIILNRTSMEKSLGYDSADNYCDDDRFSIRFKTSKKEGTNASFRLFKCSCDRSFIPYARPGHDVFMATHCEPTKETWDDRSKEIRFFHRAGQVQREQIKMAHTIQAAIVDFQHTMCFHYKGEGLVKLTLSKCQDSQNITIVLNGDMTYSFSNKQKALLKTMHRETCEDNSENWWLDIETYGTEFINGVVNVFGCQRYLREGETDDEGKPFKNLLPNSGTTLDGITTFFDLKENSSGVYSSDIKDFLDQASVVQDQSVVLGVNITSSSPITVILTRCKEQTADGIVIVQDIDEDYLSLNYTDLQKYKELSVRPTCDFYDENDALYLHIITSTSSATGSICFSLDDTSDNETPFSTQSFPKISFAMANGSVVLKKMAMADLFITAYQANKQLVFSLEANLPVSIFISKCRYSKREIVAAEPSVGNHTMTPFVVTRITKATSHRCPKDEDIGQDEVYVHLETALGPVQGTFGFYARKQTYSNNPKFTNFVALDSDRKATYLNRPFEIVTKGLNPVEVNFNHLVEEAYVNPNMDLQISINRNTPVSIFFSKCKHNNSHVPVFEFTGGVYTFTHNQTFLLLATLRSVQCDNTAKNGLFLHISDPTENDVVTLQLKDFIRSIPNNGGSYSAKDKEPYAVAIPLGKMEHGLAIRMTNVHAKSVELFLSMCPVNPRAGFELSNGPLTTAYIKLDRGHLEELMEMTENCTVPFDNNVYFTIRSQHAKGFLTIERPAYTKCSNFECSLGAIKYFNDTTNMIIA